MFDFFVVDDQKFEQFYLYENIWRETLLLTHFDDPRVPRVHDFGQLPGKIIYRQVEEQAGLSLHEYIDNHIAEVRRLADASEGGELRSKSRFRIMGSRNKLVLGNLDGSAFAKDEVESAQETARRDLDSEVAKDLGQSGLSDEDSPLGSGRVGQSKELAFNQHTLFTEVEVIDIGI